MPTFERHDTAGWRPVSAAIAAAWVASAGLACAGLGCERRLSPFTQPAPVTLRSSVTSVPGPAAPAKPQTRLQTPPGTPRESTVDVDALAAKIGVAPGAIRPATDVGSAAVLRARSGAVAVRRTGEQLFTDVGIETRLYPGDQLITGRGARALVLVSDETVIELGDSSALGIGGSGPAAAPAARAAVMKGLARFSISQRAAGVGPFLTFVEGTVIATVGGETTTFVVGVAPLGGARIGVESGQLEIVGPAALAKPTAAHGAEVVTVNALGDVSKAAPFPEDDWQAWRTGVDQRASSARELTWAREQLQRLPHQQTEIDRWDQQLVQLAARALELVGDATPADATSRAALRRYKQAAPEYGAAVEAAYRVSLELERLVSAFTAETYGLEQLFARQAEAHQTMAASAAPALVAAMLYNKKLQTIAETTLAPLRPLYLMHHPAGRRLATAIGYEVPAFFAQAALEPLPPRGVAGLLKVDLYAPPDPTPGDGVLGSARRASPRVPAPHWDAWLVVAPAPPRQQGWYSSPVSVAGTAPGAGGNADRDLKFRASLESAAEGDRKSKQ